MNCFTCGPRGETRLQTPESIDNLPGQAEVSYRVGTYSSFRDSMIRRISTYKVTVDEPWEDDDRLKLHVDLGLIRRLLLRARHVRPLRRLMERAVGRPWGQISDDDLSRAVETQPGILAQWRLLCDPHLPSTLLQKAVIRRLFVGSGADESPLLENLHVLHALVPDLVKLPGARTFQPLALLTTRRQSDPAIALLDAWAVVADVLTFYQERIANEAYLRTARERRSLIELAHLVGYKPRPGVSAGGHVAFTLDDGLSIEIPAGTACQSVPAPGTTAPPQTFETAEAIQARATWNELRPRLSRPQAIRGDDESSIMDREKVYLQGPVGNLRAGQYLLFAWGSKLYVRQIREVELDVSRQRATVSLGEDLLSATAFVREITRTVAGSAARLPDDGGPLRDLKAKLTDLQANVDPPQGQPRKSLVELDGIVQNNVVPPLDLDEFSPLLTRLNSLIDTNNNAGLSKTASRLDQANSAVEALSLRAVHLGKLGYGQGYELLKRLKDFRARFNGTPPTGDLIRQLAGEIFPANFEFEGDDVSNEVLKKSAGAIVKNKPDVENGQVSEIRSRLFVSSAQPTLGILPFAIDLIEGRLAGGPDTYWTVVKELNDNAITLRIAVEKLQQIRSSFPPTDVAKQIHELQAAIQNAVSGYVSAVNSAADVAGVLRPSITPGIIELVLVKFALDEMTHDQAPDLKGWQNIGTTITQAVSDLQTVLGGQFDGVSEPLQTLVAGLNRSHDELTQALAKPPSEPLPNLINAVKTAGIEFPRLRAAVADLGILAQRLRDSTISRRKAAVRRAVSIAARNINLDRAVLEPISKWKYPDTFTAKPTLEGIAEQLRTAIQKLEPPPSESLARVVEEFRALHERLTVAGGATAVGPPPLNGSTTGLQDVLQVFGSLLGQARNADRMAELSELFEVNSDTLARLAGALDPQVRERLFSLWRRLRTGDQAVEVYAMRERVGLFGRAAPRLVQLLKADGTPADNPILANDWTSNDVLKFERDEGNTLFLDADYTQPKAGGCVAVETPNDPDVNPYTIATVKTGPRSAYGINGKTTEITLDGTTWWSPDPRQTDLIDTIRATSVLLQGERLDLAEEPILLPIGAAPDSSQLADDLPEDTADQILLDGLVEGLSPGSRLIVEGETWSDEQQASGAIRETFVVQIAHVVHHPGSSGRPGDSTNTRLILTRPFPSRLKRDTIRLLGNVARITHGQTVRDEVLGSGDGSAPFQSFQLSQKPLTFVSAATRSGAETTLELRVNHIRWHEAASLLDLAHDERGFVVSRDEVDKVTIETGDGTHGTRLPTGVENVRATYRVGLGTMGNVKAGSIIMPPASPFGIRAVNNPLPTSGGADPEGDEQIRELAPLGVMSLERLVSIRDYSDFARTFAGIGKAEARKIHAFRRPSLLVTIDGTGDTPILRDSEVLSNLRRAYRQLGDPDLPVLVQPAERLILSLQASLGIDSDYSFENVRQAGVDAIMRAFRFEARRLGQDVYVSDVISVLQEVEGVEYVDLDAFKALPQRFSLAELRSLAGDTSGDDQGSVARGEGTRIPVNAGGVRRYRVAEDNEPAEDIVSRFFLTGVAELKLLNPRVNDWDKLPIGLELIVSLTWPAQIAYFGVPDVIVLREGRR